MANKGSSIQGRENSKYKSPKWGYMKQVTTDASKLGRAGSELVF